MWAYCREEEEEEEQEEEEEEISCFVPPARRRVAVGCSNLLIGQGDIYVGLLWGGGGGQGRGGIRGELPQFRIIGLL